MKKILFITLILLLIGQIALAQEVDYPEVPYPVFPWTIDVGEDTSFAGYVEYLFYFLVYGSGVLALLALIIAGFQYLTSAGSPDKIKEAKDRIISAILGLAIVLASFVILWRINPLFLRFELEELGPAIPDLSPGIWACKSKTDIRGAWALRQEYLTLHPTEERTEEIKTELERRLAQIETDCYRVASSGPVEPSFDNKIQRVWFVPDIDYAPAGENRKIVDKVKQYGALFFDNSGFEGEGQVFLAHIFDEVGVVPFYDPPDTLKISSIQGFKRNLGYNDPVWFTKLYEDYQYGERFDPPRDPFFDENGYENGQSLAEAINPAAGTITPLLLDSVPKSLRTDGNALVVLYNGTPIAEGDPRYFASFYSVYDENLEDNYNIVDWIPCAEYKGVGEGEIRLCKDLEEDFVNCCAKAAADAIVVLYGIEPI